MANTKALEITGPGAVPTVRTMGEQYKKDTEILMEIRDIQRETLELARQNHELARKQFDRAEALHERAEKIQDRSEGLMKGARKALIVILPVIGVLLLYLTWLIFR